MLIIDSDFIAEWHPKYECTETDEGEYQTILKIVRRELMSSGTIGKKTFLRIINWKSQRVKGLIEWDDWPRYRRVLAHVYRTDDGKKLPTITKLLGIGVPVGSTILHFMFPKRFPIIDIRTISVLRHADLISFKSASYLNNYRIFVSAIEHISKIAPGWTLREIDRALFAFDKNVLGKKSQGGEHGQDSACADSSTSGKSPKKRQLRDDRTVEEKTVDCFQGQVGKIFSTSKIKDIVIKKHPEVKAGSVIPTDYCYNLINAGITRYLKDEVTFDGIYYGCSSFRYRFFKQIKRGRFECLGLNCNYTGPIVWNEKHGFSREVGEWKKGRFRLWEEPVGESDK